MATMLKNILKNLWELSTKGTVEPAEKVHFYLIKCGLPKTLFFKDEI